MSKNLRLFYVSIILVCIFIIGRILSIITYAGTYNFVVDAISNSGYIYVGSVLNFPSFTFFGISCISLSLLALIVLNVSKNNINLSKNMLYRLLVFIGFICTILIPVIPSDLLYYPHLIVAGLLFTLSVVTSLISTISIKRFHISFLFAIETITFTILIIVGIIQWFYPLVPTGIFEKFFVYSDIINMLATIYILSENKPMMKKKVQYKRR